MTDGMYFEAGQPVQIAFDFTSSSMEGGEAIIPPPRETPAPERKIELHDDISTAEWARRIRRFWPDPGRR